MQTGTWILSLGCGWTRRDLPSIGHCRKEGIKPGVDGSFSHEPGGYKIKRKYEQEMRQQTGGITEVNSERAQKSIIHLESYVLIIFSNSAFHLQHFLFFPICNPCQIISFSFLPSISKCLLLFSPILCPFLTLITVPFAAFLPISIPSHLSLPL